MKKSLKNLWVGDRFLYIAERLDGYALTKRWNLPLQLRKELVQLAALATAEGASWNAKFPSKDT
jgi:hypothetical protein